MNDRSADVYGMTHAATEKFEYFICGVTGAIFAYITQTYQPQKLDNIFSVIQTVALVILAVSFFAGIRRIQLFNLKTRLNHALLEASEKAGRATSALAGNPAESFHNEGTGEWTTREDLERRRAVYMEEAHKMEAKLRSVQSKASRCGRVRNFFLLLGILTIFVSKVLQPYQTGSSLHSNTTAPAEKTMLPSPAPALNQTSR